MTPFFLTGSVKQYYTPHMNTLSKLKRHFLATLPVLGPHNFIEAELLLSGQKPVGRFEVDEEILADFGKKHVVIPKCYPQEGVKKNIYSYIDGIIVTRKLDKAVAEGKLISQKFDDDERGTWYYYGQLDQEDTMKALIALDKADEPGACLTHSTERGALLGYRKRDCLFFRINLKIPENICDAIEKLTDAAKEAHQYLLLEKAGVEDPEHYIENNFKELKRINDQTPDLG